MYADRKLDRERIATYSLVVGAYNYEIKAFNETSRPRQRNVDGTISLQFQFQISLQLALTFPFLFSILQKHMDIAHEIFSLSQLTLDRRQILMS